jgi:hypothetical protein
MVRGMTSLHGRKSVSAGIARGIPAASTVSAGRLRDVSYRGDDVGIRAQVSEAKQPHRVIKISHCPNFEHEPV